jgi:hypothetical protein
LHDSQALQGLPRPSSLIPVIIEGEPAVSIKVSDLKVEIASAPAAAASITRLAAEHLQYVLLNDHSGKS